ncbi:MAG: DUF4268 domain-containing protein [Stellaceae bacterium]
MDIALGKLKHFDPRKLWENEAGNFTPWLANHLQLLAEALGLDDLQLVRTEQAVGEFLCDIVAREVRTDRRVIIENQLKQTDHKHLGQLLTYAGGLDAAVVVWISPEIREEHRQALDLLNRHTDEQIVFFGVLLEAIRIDDSNPAVQFRPVAFPNEWGKAQNQGRNVSERGSVYKAFFQALLDELRERHNLPNAGVARPKGWYWFSSGVSGFKYGVAFQEGHQRLQTELYIETGIVERNKAIFNWFFSRREEIEREMADHLVWEPLEHRQASRICVVRPNTSFADAVEQGEELRKWSIDHLLRLKKVFDPKLADAVAAATATVAVEAA